MNLMKRSGWPPACVVEGSATKLLIRAPVGGSAAAEADPAKQSEASSTAPSSTGSSRRPNLRLVLFSTTVTPPVLLPLAGLLLVLPVFLLVFVLLLVFVRLRLGGRTEVGAGAVGRQRRRHDAGAVALVGGGAVGIGAFGREAAAR